MITEDSPKASTLEEAWAIKVAKGLPLALQAAWFPQEFGSFGIANDDAEFCKLVEKLIAMSVTGEVFIDKP